MCAWFGYLDVVVRGCWPTHNKMDTHMHHRSYGLRTMLHSEDGVRQINVKTLIKNEKAFLLRVSAKVDIQIGTGVATV